MSPRDPQILPPSRSLRIAPLIIGRFSAKLAKSTLQKWFFRLPEMVSQLKAYLRPNPGFIGIDDVQTRPG
jgi:hypothetical protein